MSENSNFATFPHARENIPMKTQGSLVQQQQFFTENDIQQTKLVDNFRDPNLSISQKQQKNITQSKMSENSDFATFSLAREKISVETKGDIIQKRQVSIEKDRQQAQLFEDFLDPNLPICLICCEGKVGTGKSTFMNLIALHLDSTIPKSQLFKAQASTFSATPGCQILNKKFIFNGVQIVLMDFEGQGGIIDPTRNMEDSEYEEYLNKLLCLSFVIPSVLIIVSQQRIEKADLDRLKYLESIHKRMTTQKINLPNFKWFVREGFNLSSQQLADCSTLLQANVPSILQNTSLLSIPELDQETFHFTKRQKFPVIEKLLLSATSNPQNLPRKSQVLRIFNDTFSLINNNDFEVVYGQKLGYYRVWEDWNKIENPKFEQSEQKLAMDCEKINDNGKQYEIGYQSLIQGIFDNINKRLEKDGISSYSFAKDIIFQIQARFNLTKAKIQYLKRKEEKQALEKERKQAEYRINQMERSFYQQYEETQTLLTWKSDEEKRSKVKDEQLIQKEKNLQELRNKQNSGGFLKTVAAAASITFAAAVGFATVPVAGGIALGAATVAGVTKLVNQ